MRIFIAIVTIFFIAAIGALGWYLFAAPAEPLETAQGTISGTTGYPSEFNPSQRVCAQMVGDSSQEYCVVTSEQTTPDAPTFSIQVPVGTYYVYATLRNPADAGLEDNLTAYWTEFVQCGLHVGCASHAKIPVIVSADETVSEIRPVDWYTNF